jgi:putative FmdB family regulatory protein
MPFYEYQCRACGAQVEVMQKINDAPLKKCPECAKNQLTRLISAPVFRLKGGGWYETDFKGDKDNKRNLASGDTDSAPAAASDAKPAASKAAEPAAAPAAATVAAKPVTRRTTQSKAKSKPAKRAPAGKARK